MTVYCYDTEFLEDGKTIDLISIGIVCDDGREYYAVNSEMPAERIKKDDWLCQNVIPHLPLTGDKPRYRSDIGGRWIYSLNMQSTAVKPKWVIANEVREFLTASGTPELWAYYAAYDHVALAQLWGPMIHLPKGIPMYTHDLKQEMDRVGVSSGAVPKPENAHCALDDARWNWQMLYDIRHQELLERRK